MVTLRLAWLVVLAACGSAEAPRVSVVETGPQAASDDAPEGASEREPALASEGARSGPASDVAASSDVPPSSDVPERSLVLRGRIRARGALTDRTVYERTRQLREAATECFSSPPSGSFTLVFRVMADGSIEDPRVEDATALDMGVCGATLLDELTMPASTGETRVRIDLRFMTEAEAAAED